MNIKNVYKKLSKARAMLSNTSIKKSGLNSYSKYNYFELGDFLPSINRIFEEIGLCSHITFSDSLATLSIIDVDDNSIVDFFTHTEKVEMKGAMAIQNLGAMHTYVRRYLWLMAMEISESDVVDAQEHSKNTTQVKKQEPQNSKQQLLKTSKNYLSIVDKLNVMDVFPAEQLSNAYVISDELMSELKQIHEQAMYSKQKAG